MKEELGGNATILARYPGIKLFLDYIFHKPEAAHVTLEEAMSALDSDVRRALEPKSVSPSLVKVEQAAYDVVSTIIEERLTLSKSAGDGSDAASEQRIADSAFIGVLIGMGGQAAVRHYLGSQKNSGKF